LAISGDVARNLKAKRRNSRSEQCHTGELVVAGKMSGLGRVSVLRPAALVDACRLH
jgi:hypothetical protein